MGTFERVMLGLAGTVLLVLGGLVAFYAATADEHAGTVVLGAGTVAFVGLLLCSAALVLPLDKKSTNRT